MKRSLDKSREASRPFLNYIQRHDTKRDLFFASEAAYGN